MTRAILPCKNRRAARQGKQAVARRGRRRMKQALGKEQARRGFEAEEDGGEGRCLALIRLQDIDRGRAVWCRRSGDKVNGFIRWVRARTRGCASDRAALDQIKGIMRRQGCRLDNVITEHALGHFYRPEWDHRRPWTPPGPPPSPFRDREHLRRCLIRAHALAHGGLNAALRRLEPWRTDAEKSEPAPLLLRGHRELEPLAERLWRPPRRWSLEDHERFERAHVALAAFFKEGVFFLRRARLSARAGRSAPGRPGDA